MTRPGNSKGQFEREWQDMLGDIRKEPPAQVWNNIDRELAYAELDAYKTRNLRYKWLAAAVVLLAFGVLAFQYTYFQERLDRFAYTGVVDVDGPTVTETEIPEVPETPSKSPGQVSSMLLAEKQDESTTGLPAFGADDQRARAVNGALEAVLVRQNGTIETLDLTPKKPEVTLNTSYRDKYFSYIPTYHFEQSATNDRSRYWAGVNVGGNSFDPNYQSNGNSLLSTSLDVNPNAFSLAENQSLDTESPAVREGMLTGQAVSLGVDFGFKIGKRWMVESGLQYARADAVTQTNVVIQTEAFQEVIPATSQVSGVLQQQDVVAVERVLEYDYRDVRLNNQFEFAAVPVKAGYLLVDRRISVEVNAGVLANIYLGNKLTGSDNEIAEVTLGPGEVSPYRDLSFSGLAGVELGYRFFDRFDLVIEPNYRRALNPLTKDESNFVTNPSGFGLMTGIRYNFR